MATQTVTNTFDTFKHFELDDSLKGTLDAFDESNIRARFKQAKDPVYLAFKYIDKKPLAQLAKEFVTDNTADLFTYLSGFFK